MIHWTDQIKSLSLEEVSDADLRSIDNLQCLTSLYLTHATVTDKIVDELGEIEALSCLRLIGCPLVTNELVLGLKNHLTQLSITDNENVNDETCRLLSQQTDLERLDLTGTNITDAGLTHLLNLRQLMRLTLSSCYGVTDAGVRMFRSKTNCNVSK